MARRGSEKKNNSDSKDPGQGLGPARSRWLGPSRSASVTVPLLVRDRPGGSGTVTMTGLVATSGCQGPGWPGRRARLRPLEYWEIEMLLAVARVRDAAAGTESTRKSLSLLTAPCGASDGA
jgi:hypothetical protein